MTEQEYIDATNLAKLRIAYSVASSLFPTRAPDHKDKTATVRALDRMIQRLEKRVTTEEAATDERGE